MPETFERGALGRLRLHVLPTKRFKTFAVSLFAGIPLSESGVTPTALTPFVLRRGTRSYPETIAFREKLDELYGAGFGFDLYKRGDYQVVQFRMDIINDRFVSHAGSLLQEALRFLGEVATEPALEDGRFRARYVEAEKTTVAKRLEAIINDKIRYAGERCVEEMCRDEPYRLPALGRKEDLAALDAGSLYASYRGWLEQASLDLYVAGDTSLEEVRQLAGEAFRLPAGDPAGYAPARTRPARSEAQTIVERLDVGQGKLNLGLRTGTLYGSEDYPALLLYNGLLGAFPHSKLFVNVREKASLAYYASSRLDGHKGLMTIQSGIEIANYGKALDIIREQLAAMERGEFGEEDLARTKAMLSNQLREIDDSAFERIGFDFHSVMAGKERTGEQMIQELEAVTPDQITAAARAVKLDTIYFLRDRKGEG
ncbi:EF-P 5-aminopentanol modification-associated protein YfmF [Cohnella caldifontis]|uniref:EF-P 5-aminopentanol modification-associated protein YfmF n=1 Tax=Cohnella caldifontis TaxID=3027471 RepID=UPI0023ECF840|nr:pitrilysin family protein [Cohnella sp. YIM B05605]